MSFLLVFTTLITYYYILHTAGESFKIYEVQTRKNQWLTILLLLTHSLFFVLAQYFYIPTYASFLILLVLMFLTFYTKFDEHILPLYFASIHYVFYIYTIRSIVLSIAAIIFNTNILKITSAPLINLLLFQLTLLLSLLYFNFLRKRFFSVDNVKILLRYPRQLAFVLIHKTVLGLFMMLITYGVHFSNNDIWFNHFHLIASVLFTFLGTYTLKNGISVTKTLDYKEHTEFLEKQLTMQKQQYEAQQEYTDSFRKFKHDFNSIMANVNLLLENGKNREAQKLLGQISNKMESNVATQKQYSNNQVINLILQDFAKQCRSHQIEFNAKLFWHKDIQIEELSLMRIFNNSLKNALEANLFVKEKRFIKIESKLHDHWLSIQISNPYDGYIHKDMKSRKQNKTKHGMGTKIIEEEVEKAGGFSDINYDETLFKLIIHFPITKNKH